MATILIEAFQIKTAGGFPADVIGIDITSDTDQIVGEIQHPKAGTIRVRWDLNGIARDNSHEFNLDTADISIRDVIETVERLQG